MTAETKIVITAATAQAESALRGLGSSLDGMSRKFSDFKSMAGTLGAALSVTGMVAFFKGTIDAADHLNDLSKSTNIAIADLAGLKLLANQTGTDLDGLAKGINKMSVEMGKAPEKFLALGITAKDNTHAFAQLADIFNSLTDINQRNALAQAAFGKSWAEMAPALSEGGAKILDTIEKGKRLSGMTQEMGVNADKFKDQMAELNTTIEATGIKIVSDMLGPMNKIAEAMRKAAEEGGLLKAALVGIGGFMSEGMAGWTGTSTRKEQIAKEMQSLREDNATAQKWGGPLAMISDAMKDKLNTELNARNQRMLALQKELEAIQNLDAAKSKSNFTEEEAMALGKQKYDAAVRAAAFLDAHGEKNLDQDILKNNLKGFEDSIKREDSLLAFRNKTLDFYHSENLTSTEDYYAAKKTVQEMALAATLAGYDKEIAALNKFKSDKDRTTKEITDANAQIATLKEKKSDATLKSNESSTGDYFQRLKEDRKNEIEGNQVLLGLEKDYQNELEKRSDALKAPLLSANERLLADDMRNVTKRAQDSRIELEKMHDAGSLSAETYALRLQQVTADEEKQKEAVSALAAEQDKLNASWQYGAAVALRGYLDEVQNVAKSTEEMMTRAFKGMEDALVNFVKTGKLDFKSLADSIITDMIRIQIQQSITGPLASWMGSLFTPAPTGMAGFSAEQLAGPVMSANGNVFSGAGISAYSGRMVDKPTLFPFARGTGLMGEAGPEAILPLKRDSSGKLGVSGGGSNIVVNVINNASQQVTATPQQNQSGGFDLIISQIENKIGGNIARGTGAVNAAITHTFGMNRVAGSY